MKYAFTLAETLITLVIVGVVAALTLPTLIARYQKEQTVTKLKKAYSTIYQATNRAIADNGPIDTWETLSLEETGYNNKGDITFVEKYLAPYLKINRLYSPQTFTSRCDGSKYQTTLLNSETKGSGCHGADFYLDDGVLVSLSLNHWQINNPNQFIYATLLFDINGMNKPNKMGKDIFRYVYYISYGSSSNSHNGKFVPWGYEAKRENLISPSGNNCNKAANGICCAALIMKDGWKISDDYPW